MNGMKRNTDKGRCPLCLSDKDVIHILLDCLGTINWRTKCLKLLRMNKDVAYRKTFQCCNKDQIRDFGRYLNKTEYEWFNRTKVNTNITTLV